MAHGPKSAQKRARRVRKANRMAQELGYKGAAHLVAQGSFTIHLVPAAMAAIAAGY